MDNLHQILERAGLNKREAALYLALLKMGPSSILSIAKKAEMKRPTAYLVIDELAKKGLVAEVPKEKKKKYVALSPERLADALEDRAMVLKRALPELLSFYRGQTDRPHVQIFESKEGMLNVYREITHDKSIKEILAYVDPASVPKEFNENWELFVELFSKRSVRGRELVTKRSAEHFYIKKVNRLPNHETRYAPEEIKFFSDTVIYGNKAAIFSFKKSFAMIIESEDAVQSLKSLFELAWMSAGER